MLHGQTTNLAAELKLVCVHEPVPVRRQTVRERLVADLALVDDLVSVRAALVPQQVVPPLEALAARFARHGLGQQVRLLVAQQVLELRELSVADVAREVRHVAALAVQQEVPVTVRHLHRGYT